MAYLDNFYFELHGDKGQPKAVLLHGLMGSSANWRKIVPALTPHYQVLCYDQRGHGKSFHPAHGYAPEDYAQDLALILGELGWQQIFLVGHSMGGRNALAFALDFPHCVKALVIEDIVPSSPASALSRTEELIKSVPTPFEHRRAAKEFFANDFVRLFADYPQIEQYGQFFYSNIIEDDHGRGVWRVFMPGILASLSSARAKNRWPDLERLAVPTLLIRGQNSLEVSPSEYQRALAASPFIQGLVIDNAGHWVHFDQPQRFTDAVLDFFAQARTLASGRL